MTRHDWAVLTGIALGYVLGALLWAVFGPAVKRAFARWRLKVWDRRLAFYRREWNRATVADIGPRELNGVPVDQFWERLVTQALLKRTKWLKRSRKLSARGGSVES